MTDEERQRQMDFILQSQARSEKRLDRLERIVKLAVRAGVRTRRDVREQLGALIDAQIHTDGALARLAEAQAHTDRRLDALIDIVREGRNGNGRGQG
ncbi:MAG: hypothetical protein LC800_20535 [Acidobacteria bacterium]|nr:hypothetical protein [Acidobacteriota bacterium]